MVIPTAVAQDRSFNAPRVRAEFKRLAAAIETERRPQGGKT